MWLTWRFRIGLARFRRHRRDGAVRQLQVEGHHRRPVFPIGGVRLLADLRLAHHRKTVREFARGAPRLYRTKE
jgi:hypothetical protein